LAGKRTRDTERRLLAELLKNSKKSDRELARVLGVSQPTVSRIRVKLERKKLIKQYTIIPDLVEMGFEILAVTTFQSKVGDEIVKRAVEWTNKKPSVLFAARAEGTGRNALMLSIHKSYSEYSDFIDDVIREGEGVILGFDTTLVSLKGRIIKHFSFDSLAKIVEASK
jgi:DNA-binding Lrp family transcriptional regulator